jgi:dTDP-4-dehydrorhamnose reductase
MKLWVTGGQGMLGKTLQQLCGQKGFACIATSHSEADLTNPSVLLQIAKQIQPTHIINCAAYTDVDGAEKNEERAFAVNASGARNLALAALEVGAKLIQISTDYVFDGFAATPYREEDLSSPINVYGRSKWEGEKQVLDAYPKACIIRTSWLFGSQGKNFISSVHNWLQEKEKIQVVADQSGRPTFVKDLALAVLDLLDAEGIIHFANAGPVSRYQLALDIREEMLKSGKPVRCSQIEPVASQQFPTPAKRPSYSVLATEKFTQITGKQPRPWKEAIGEYFEHVIAAS